MSDNESIIPDSEIPKIEKKVRKKKEMTPQMIEQLRLAREKAIAVKKLLKNNPEARVEHYKEKLKKHNEKPKSKKQLLQQATEEYQKEQLLDGNKGVIGEIEEPKEQLLDGNKEQLLDGNKEQLLDDNKGVIGEIEEPVEEIKIKDDNKGVIGEIEEPVEEIKIKEPEPVKESEFNLVDLSIDNNKIVRKEKKKVKYIYESDTSSDEDRVVYVKKNNKKNIPKPTMPRTFGGQNTSNRFGSYSMFGRR